MRKPKMIIFDAGRTLIDYVSVDTLKGVRAVMAHAVLNPQNFTAEEVDAFVNQTFEHFEAARKQLFEVHAQTILKLAYDRLGIELSIPFEEVERLVWYRDPVVEPVEGAVELVKRITEMGIRTAVISNLDFSGYLLGERLDALFPDNQFEFVLASSDYGIRKPARYLFEAGIRKIRLLSK